MEFEFDASKSAANLAKHGLDFVEAQALWRDPLALVIQARSDTEPRWLLIGACKSRLWCAFYTQRSGRIRIISVRRARENEERLYHESGAT